MIETEARDQNAARPKRRHARIGGALLACAGGCARAWPLCLTLAIALATFGRTSGFPFVVMDDAVSVTANPLTEHPLSRGLAELFLTRELGYPMPVTVLSYALERRLFGLSPAALHAGNLALHLANVCLAFFVARRLGLAPRWCALPAVIVGLHPLVVEPVCWISGRKDLLACGFVLWAVLVALEPVHSRPAQRAGRWALVLSLCALGALSKPSAVVAPVLVGLAVTAARPSTAPRRTWLALAPALAFSSFLVAVGTKGQAEVGALERRTAWEAVQDVAGAAALQVAHLFWPADLEPKYNRVAGDPSVLLQVLALAALASLVAAVWRSTERGSLARLGLAAAGVAYLPASSALALVRWTADSYLYLALPWLGIALAAMLSRALRRGEFWSALLALLLGAASFRQVPRWSGSLELFAPLPERYPGVPEAHSLHAFALQDEGRHAEAMQVFRALDARFPDFELYHGARAVAVLEAGERARALELIEAGVWAGDPNCAELLWRALVTAELPDAAKRGELLAESLRIGGARLATLSPPARDQLAAVFDALGFADAAREVRSSARP